MACNSTYLDELIIARDAVVHGLRDGKSLVEVSIRGKTVTYEPSTKLVDRLNAWIAQEERKQNAARGPARNVARVNR